MEDFLFDHLDRQTNWSGIFNTIDENFDKATEYLSSIGNKVHIEKFTVNTADQSYFNLSSTYNTNSNSLAVYINGARQWVNSGFTETTKRSFRLTTPAHSGDEVVAVYNDNYVITGMSNIEMAFRALIHKGEFNTTIKSAIKGSGSYLVDLEHLEDSNGNTIRDSLDLDNTELMSGHLYGESNNLYGSVYENTGHMFAMVTQVGENIKIGDSINVTIKIYSLDTDMSE